jgi:hypothetical protein
MVALVTPIHPQIEIDLLGSTPITIECTGISWGSHYASDGLSLCLALLCIAELSRVTPGEHADEFLYLR